MRKLGTIFIALILFLVVTGFLSYFILQFKYKKLTEDARSSHGGHYIELDDGIISHSWYGPETGSIVVLVNGLSTPAFVWDRSVHALAEAGNRVLAFDHYGRGFSDRPDVVYDIDLYDRQLINLLDAFHIRDSVSLVGYSLGGAVVINFAARHPEKVKKLVLIAPAGYQPEPSGAEALVFIPGIGELIMELIGKEVMLGEMKNAIKDNLVSPEMLSFFEEQFQYAGYLPALLSTIRNYSMKETIPSYEETGKLGIPTLVIWGTEDLSVPFECSHNVKNAIPHAKIHAFQGMDHTIAYSRPDIVNPLLVNFLGSE